MLMANPRFVIPPEAGIHIFSGFPFDGNDRIEGVFYGYCSMDKKRIKKEKKIHLKRRVLLAEDLLQLMEEEDRPLLLREILRRFGLQEGGETED